MNNTADFRQGIKNGMLLGIIDLCGLILVMALPKIIPTVLSVVVGLILLASLWGQYHEYKDRPSSQNGISFGALAVVTAAMIALVLAKPLVYVAISAGAGALLLNFLVLASIGSNSAGIIALKSACSACYGLLLALFSYGGPAWAVSLGGGRDSIEIPRMPELDADWTTYIALMIASVIVMGLMVRHVAIKMNMRSRNTLGIPPAELDSDPIALQIQMADPTIPADVASLVSQLSRYGLASQLAETVRYALADTTYAVNKLSGEGNPISGTLK